MDFDVSIFVSSAHQSMTAHSGASALHVSVHPRKIHAVPIPQEGDAPPKSAAALHRMFWCVNMIALLKDSVRLGTYETARTRHASMENVEMEMQDGLNKLSRGRSRHRWRNVVQWMKSTYTMAPAHERQARLQEKFHQERQRKSATADSLLPKPDVDRSLPDHILPGHRLRHSHSLADQLKSLSVECLSSDTCHILPVMAHGSRERTYWEAALTFGAASHDNLRRSTSLDIITKTADKNLHKGEFDVDAESYGTRSTCKHA